MMNNVINTRDDLDAIEGTPEHAAFMAMLSGTLWRMEKDDAAKTWVAVEDNTTIERFGFIRSDFPNAQSPLIPAYEPVPPPTVQEQIAAIEAQFTTTLQMRVSLQEPEAITQVQGMYTQIAELKAQL